MNFFEYYDLSMAFHLDEDALRKAFHGKSKAHHPDLYLGDEEKYNQALEESGFNNRAYQTLKSADSRLKYILEIHGALDQKQELPPEFLMDMMEFNEGLMEAQMEGEGEKITQLKEQFADLKRKLEQEIDSATRAWDTHGKPEELNDIKSLYLKQKYLNRIQESFDRVNGV